MKLLFCGACESIFDLDYFEKQCKCGLTKGKYIDNRNAEFSGTYAIPLGFDNRSFFKAIRNQPVEDYGGESFDAFVIPKKCKTYIKTEK